MKTAPFLIQVAFMVESWEFWPILGSLSLVGHCFAFGCSARHGVGTGSRRPVGSGSP